MNKSFRIWLTKEKKFIYHFHRKNWNDKEFKNEKISFNPNYSIVMPCLNVKDCQEKIVFDQDQIEYFHPEHCNKILGFGSYMGYSPAHFKKLGLLRISPQKEGKLKKKHPNLIIQKAENRKYNIYFLPLEGTIKLNGSQYGPRHNEKFVLDLCDSKQAVNTHIYPKPYFKVTGNPFDEHLAPKLNNKNNDSWKWIIPIAAGMIGIGMLFHLLYKNLANLEKELANLKLKLATETDKKKRKALKEQIQKTKKRIQEKKKQQKFEEYKKKEIERLRQFANLRIND